MHNIKRLAVIALLALAPLLGGCMASDKTVISNAASMNDQLKPAVIEDPKLSNYLQSVGERIIEVAKELDAQHIGPKTHFEENNQWMFSSNMKFHFVNSKTLNAFTTGGEHMYIYNELFQQCKSEEELAAVMAHEYAHVYCRHVGKGMQRQYTALAAAAALGGAGYVAGGKEHGGEYAAIGASAGAIAGQFANMGFTRGDEDEADKYGFLFYTRAGWDPDHFADFFKTMIAKGYDKTPQMMSDHPTLANRVEATQRRVKELSPNADQWRTPPIADAQEFSQLQQIARADAKKYPDDKSLANSQQLATALPRSCVMPADPADAVQAREQIAKKAEAAQQPPQKTTTKKKKPAQTQ